MVGGTEAIPLLFIYKNLKSRLLLLETSFLEECILLTLSSLFEDFPLEREKLNKLMNKETDTTKENHDVAAESTE
jgi:hypothetical protein